VYSRGIPLRVPSRGCSHHCPRAGAHAITLARVCCISRIRQQNLKANSTPHHPLSPLRILMGFSQVDAYYRDTRAILVPAQQMVVFAQPGRIDIRIVIVSPVPFPFSTRKIVEPSSQLDNSLYTFMIFETKVALVIRSDLASCHKRQRCKALQ